jgi:hypothetical protein
MTDAVADKLGIDRVWWEQALQIRDRFFSPKELAVLRANFNHPPPPNLSKTEVDRIVEPLKTEIERLKNLPVKEVEVSKTPNWAEEMLGYIDLLKVSTDEERLKIIHDVEQKKAVKEREKALVKALEVLGVENLIVTPIPKPEELELKAGIMSLSQLEQQIAELKEFINNCETFEGKVKLDLLTQVKRQFANAQRIEEELNAQLLLYQPKFNAVKAAIPYLKENLAIMEKVATKKKLEAVIPPEAVIKSHGEGGFKRLVNGIKRVKNELS